MDIKITRPDIRQLNLIYLTTKLPLNKQKNHNFLNSCNYDNKLVTILKYYRRTDGQTYGH